MIKKCLSCEGAVEEGVLVDQVAHGPFKPSRSMNWAEKITMTSVKGRREIVSYRCTKCGLLQNYAE